MNRSLTALAGLSAAGLAFTGLQMPAQATPADAALGSAAVAKKCSFTAKGESLKIALGLYTGSEGVESISVRATDNDESGSYDNNDVRIKNIRITLWDIDGKKQLDNTVAPSSPGSFDVGSAGDGAGKVRVKVRWRTHGSTVNASCTKVLPS